MKPIRVLLADDHTLVRIGIRALLETLPDVEVVGEASTGREALVLVPQTRPDLVLLDIVMKEMSGLDALARLAEDFPAVKVLMLSGHLNRDYVLTAIRAGAAGYLVKDTAADELPTAIRAVMDGKAYFSPSVSQIMVEAYLGNADQSRQTTENLTPRQREVLTLTAEGRNTKQIASALGISVKTVEAHRTQLMSRLGIYEIAGLVRYAIRMGLVSS